MNACIVLLATAAASSRGIISMVNFCLSDC